ncbi:MAG: hypothetical protein ACON4V_04440 [Parvibaculales bacterium]
MVSDPLGHTPTSVSGRATSKISLGVVLAIILSGPSGFGAIAATIERWLHGRKD